MRSGGPPCREAKQAADMLRSLQKEEGAKKKKGNEEKSSEGD